MDKKKVLPLHKKINSLQRQLATIGPCMRGSVVLLGKPEKKKPFFSVGIKGKTRLIYLGDNRQARARQFSENYQRLLQIIDEMTEANMDLLKANAWDD